MKLQTLFGVMLLTACRHPPTPPEVDGGTDGGSDAGGCDSGQAPVSIEWRFINMYSQPVDCADAGVDTVEITFGGSAQQLSCPAGGLALPSVDAGSYSYR